MDVKSANAVFQLLYWVILFIPPALLLLRKFSLIPVKQGLWLAAISFVLLYVTYVGANEALRYSFELERVSYDTNGDGHLEKSEMSAEQWERVVQMTRDTGIQLAPFFGIFVALIYTGFWFVATWTIGAIAIALKDRRENL